MSRSFWAAAAGALAFALTPGVALAARGSHAGRSAGAHARRHHPPAMPGRGGRTGRVVVLALGTGYDLPAGSTEVRAVQRRLGRLGFSPGPIDGRYGPLTAAAVARLQAASALTVDGVAGPHTLAMLDHTHHAVLAPGAGYQQPRGSRRVRTLQRRLRRLGFAPGPIDGRYGPLTTRAIRRFQGTRHLATTGVIGLRTWLAVTTAGRRFPASRRTAAPPPSAPATRPAAGTHPQSETPLPVVPVLLALAALGLAAAAHSYQKTRRRLQRMPRTNATTNQSSGPTRQGAEPEARPPADGSQYARPGEDSDSPTKPTASPGALPAEAPPLWRDQPTIDPGLARAAAAAYAEFCSDREAASENGVRDTMAAGRATSAQLWMTAIAMTTLAVAYPVLRGHSRGTWRRWTIGAARVAPPDIRRRARLRKIRGEPR